MFHPILRFTRVGNRALKLLLRVKVDAVAFDGPHRTVNKSAITYAQTSGAIGLELIAHTWPYISGSSYHNMNVIRPRIGDP